MLARNEAVGVATSDTRPAQRYCSSGLKSWLSDESISGLRHDGKIWRAEMRLKLFRWVPVLGLVALGLGWSVPAAHAKAAADAGSKPQNAASPGARRLSLTSKPWKGDFDGMLERRVIRFYVPYSRSLYFIDKGRERGIAAYLIRNFERWVNKKYAKQLGKRPLTVFVVVATRDKLRADLLEGRADVAVGNIKVLDELQKDVDFVAPDEYAASTEILATGPASPAIASIDDLAGKSVQVRKVSSYYLSLTALNARFKKEHKQQVEIALLPDALEDEDILEMLNAGLLQAIVVDDWKAKAWAQVLPKVKIHEDIVLRPKTRVGWAIRKHSPKLAAELNEFYAYFAKTHGGGAKLIGSYTGKVKALKNAGAGEDQKRFEALIAVFQLVLVGTLVNLTPVRAVVFALGVGFSISLSVLAFRAFGRAGRARKRG